MCNLNCDIDTLESTLVKLQNSAYMASAASVLLEDLDTDHLELNRFKPLAVPFAEESLNYMLNLGLDGVSEACVSLNSFFKSSN